MKRYGIYVAHLPCLILVDGQWGNWRVYETCSKSCGSGTKVRTRLCDNPSPLNGGVSCTGPGRDETTCKANPCPGSLFIDEFLMIHFAQFAKIILK